MEIAAKRKTVDFPLKAYVVRMSFEQSLTQKHCHSLVQPRGR